MRGGPQGQPPGVPSILGTSKTLQVLGKRHNKACLPRQERNGIYPAPITRTITANPNHCSLCFGGQNITLGLRRASLLDTTLVSQRSRNSTNHQKLDERYTCHSLRCFWSSRGISGHHPQCTSVGSSKSTASGFRISTGFPSWHPYHSTKEHSIQKTIFTIWSPV